MVAIGAVWALSLLAHKLGCVLSTPLPLHILTRTHAQTRQSLPPIVASTLSSPNVRSPMYTTGSCSPPYMFSPQNFSYPNVHQVETSCEIYALQNSTQSLNLFSTTSECVIVKSSLLLGKIFVRFILLS